VSLPEDHVITSALSNEDNAVVSSESTQPILSSPREGFQHNNNKILPQTRSQNLIHMTCKIVPDMSYNVFGVTLNLAQSINQSDLEVRCSCHCCTLVDMRVNQKLLFRKLIHYVP